MAYTEQNSKQLDTQQDPSKKDARSGNERPDFGIPNSVMAQMIGGADDGNNKPGSTVYRQFSPHYHQIPSAEAEADRLSAGIRATNPDEVMREMGSRLDADFSNVQFHTDINSVRRATLMGARAWTTGHDVYFGKGGFEPRIAAHELVHTVQQGAVKGNVSQHAPAGSVQMWWPFGKKHAEVDTSTYDNVDFLVKMEAGRISNRGESEANKNIAYAKTFNEAKDLNLNDEKAKTFANYAKKSTHTQKTSRLSENQRTENRNKLRNLSYDDYYELMNRFEDAAVALYDYRQDLGESDQPGELDFKAANSPQGRNYNLFKSIINRLPSYIDRGTLESWKQDRSQTVRNDQERTEKILGAADIYDIGTDASKNTYLTTKEGIKSMKKAGSEADSYYKKVYKGKAGPKKKTAIDKLAERYRQRKDLEKQREGNANPRNNNVPSAKKNNLIIDDDSENNIIRNNSNLSGMKENNLIIGDDSEEDIIRTNSYAHGMKEKDDSGFGDDLLNKSFNEKDQINIRKDLLDEDEDNILGIPGANNIIRSSAPIDERLAAKFSPGNKHIGNVKEAKNHLGLYKEMANLSAQASLLAHSSTVGNSISSGANGLGLISGGLGIAAGINAMKRDVQNVRAGGEKKEIIGSGLDTLTSATSFVSGGLGTLNNLAKIDVLSGPLSSVSGLGGANLVPGLNIATGVGTAAAGLMQWKRGQNSINDIDQQITALNGLKDQNGGRLTDDQKTLMHAFNQGKYKSEMNRTSGAMKAFSGALTAGSGIATMAMGPLGPAVGLGLGLASLGATATRFGYEKYKKYQMRKNVTAEDMDINWKDEMKKVREMFPNQKLSDKEVRAIILKGHGYKEGTRTAALKSITLKRAKLLIHTAEGKGPEAQMTRNFIAAMGVHPRNGNYYANGAAKLLAEKLG